MLKSVFRWLSTFFFLLVMFMTGILSLGRETWMILSPHASPANLLWRCVWIAFVLSAVGAWWQEHKRAEKAAIQLTDALTKPSFTGYVYQLGWSSRTGLVSPKMIGEFLTLIKKPADPEPEYRCDCDFFIEAYIVNEAPGVGGILEFGLELEVLGTVHRLKREPSFEGFVQERKIRHHNVLEGNVLIEQKWETVPDLGVLISGVPLAQGHSREGWVHFVLEDVNPVPLNKDTVHVKSFSVIDCYGREHVISKARMDKRDTSIHADVMRAK
jgi:hypothetical protein